MKIVKVGLHLTLHSLALRLKFPAAVFLQLELNKMRREIVSNYELGSKPIKLNREIREQVDLVYNAQLQQFEQKRMNIVILIKTKNNPNKLTAGIVEIDLKTPECQLQNVKLKPNRCNDQNAYLEYSLKIQPIKDQGQYTENQSLKSSRGQRNRAMSTPKLINTLVQFRNNQMRTSETRQNELLRLLSDSHQADSNHSRRKYVSTQKLINRQSSDIDESKTERRSYGLNRSIQCLSKKEESAHVINQLNRKYETAKKTASEAQQNVVTLTQQTKQLKKKIKQLEEDLSQQQTIVRNLTKKIQLKENASGDEVKQLRNKLQQTETQLHELITQKNNLLNSIQSREREMLFSFKEKEKMFNEERRDILLQLDHKDQALKQTTQQLSRIKQNVGVSQAMVDLLTDTNNKLEQKLQSAKNEAAKYKIQLQKMNEDVVELEKLFNSQMQVSGQIKSQKKIIIDLQRYKDEAELIIKQKDNEINKLKAEREKIEAQLKSKSLGLAVITKQLEQQNSLFETLKQKEKELTARANRYEEQLKNQHLNTGKIGKHVKEVEFELSKIKMQVQNTATTKAKKISDYEKVNELLNKKMELLAQENLQMAAKYMELMDKYRVKEDELYELGQQIIRLKQKCMNLQVQVQTLREDNNQLHSQTKVLDLRQEQICKLKEQIEYKDKLMEDLEHQHQLRQIEANNDLKLYSLKVEEREDQIKELNDYISRLERQQLELHEQIQNLNYSIKNKENEVQYIKHDYERQRKNNMQFEQRMNILTATENASLTSVEQLRLENLSFKNMFRENEHAINTLGKRYDALLKGTVQSLQRLLDILKNSKNIINQSIKHQKVEISTLLNDCIRFIAEQRKQKKEQLSNVQRELAEESDKNRQNLKLIKIKTQIQEQLERQIASLKKLEETFQNKLSNKQNQILEYQAQIRDKISNIRELNLLVENTKKEGKNQLAKKDAIINQKAIEIEKLKQQLIGELEKWKAQTLILTKKAETTQNELNNKLANQQSKMSQIQAALKTEKQSGKLMKLKNADLQNTIAKLGKQKEDKMSEIQKRTKDLIAVRVQSEFKSKLINEKQAEISQGKKTIEKLIKEKESLQNKRNWLEEGNKSLVINRNELEQSLRAKNDELHEANQKIRVIQQSQGKLAKEKDDLIKQRKQQLENITKLNETIKNLKDQLVKKDSEINRLVLQKESAEKDYNKKINVITREKQGLQKHLKEFKTKQSELETQNNNKYNMLQSQMQILKDKNAEYELKIGQMETEIEENQTKIAGLTYQLAEKLHSKLNTNQLSEEKRKELLQLILELKQLRNSEKNKNLSKIASTLENERSKQLSKYWRELTLLINQLKIKLNRLNIQSETKTALLQDVKHLQIAYENICKCSVF